MSTAPVYDLIPEHPTPGIVTVQELAPALEKMYDNGVTRGVHPGWDTLADYYLPQEGQVTFVGGTPSHGKTRFVSHMMLNIMTLHHWKFAAFSPESRPERFVKQLLEQYTGKCFDLVPDKWRSVQPRVERMTKEEMWSAQAWLHDHFSMIAPPHQSATIPGMLQLARRQVEYEGVKGIIFDPWSWVAKTPARGQLLTHYVAEQLVNLKHFCTEFDCHLWLIAHPTKLRQAEKGPYAGLYAPPTLYDISDSAHFYNMADMGLCVWRNTDTNDPETEIHIQKVKFEENGQTGKVKLFYDKYTKRYHDIGTEPVRTYEY